MGFSRLHNIAKHLLVLFYSLDQKFKMFNIFPFFFKSIKLICLTSLKISTTIFIYEYKTILLA